MVAQLDPNRNAPIYNIKAVARLTGIPADTLRRWESRYSIIVPQRTGSGYRLYSQRDVDTILWLKARLEEGMAISRACEMLRHIGGDPGPVSQGAPAPAPRLAAAQGQPRVVSGEVRSFEALCAELLEAFRNVDETKAGETLSDALSLYSVEDVCLHVIRPALVAVGEGWQRGEVSVAVEHFAASFSRARLENLFHSSPHNLYGPLVLVGCAPEELHEIGPMFLALFLRRAGYRVVYLGQNVPLESLMALVQSLKPDAVCISATRAETAAALYPLRANLDEMRHREAYTPLLAYGGQVFNRYPQISERLGGLYLGEDVRVAIQELDKRLRTERRVQ